MIDRFQGQRELSGTILVLLVAVPLRSKELPSLPASKENSTVYCSLTSAFISFWYDCDSAISFNSVVAYELLQLRMPSYFARHPFSRVSSFANTTNRAYFAY